jgi:hypothetical protein
MEVATIATVKLVTDLLKPLIDKLSTKISGDLKLNYHRIFDSYSEYVKHEYERHSRFTSIVFKNEQKRLEDYYIPLTLVKQVFGSDETVEEKINSYPLETVNSINKLLIVDTAGMGKSTLLKFLFIHCVKQEAGIPIFVELRKLSSKKLLLDYIIEQLAGIDGKTERSLVINLLESGEFVFFFDGYDEITDSERAEVTANLQTFITKAPENKYFITSRDEQGLVAFADFQRFTIKPLFREEAFCLLRKYAENNLAETLIARLKQPEYQNMEEFLVNPLLTSLLYKSFEYKAIIPLKRHIFYRQVFEALYEAHDLTKEGGEFQRKKQSNLDIDALEQVLRYLGYLTYKAQKVEYTKDELLDFVDKAKQLAAQNSAKSSQIIHDLTHAVPLMLEEGNYIRWAHRSIQEYFAALCICRNMQGKQLEILLKYYRDNDFSSHINLIALCADIEPSYFRQSILKDLLENLLQEFNSIYQNMRNSISPELIRKRKQLVVGKKIFFSSEDMDIHQVINELNDSVIMTTTGYAFGTLTLCSTLIFNTIEALQSQGLQLNFIIQLRRTRSEQIDLSNLIQSLHPIDDDPSMIYNQMDYFEKINNIIERVLSHDRWKFDEISAQKTLDEINNEISAQLDFLDF